MGIPFGIICCLSLATFNICSFCLTIISLICMCLGVLLLWVYPVWDSLGFLHLSASFLPHLEEFFDYHLLKHFLMTFLFLFFFWDTFDSNVGVFNIAPEVSEVVLISINSYLFSLSSSLISTTLFHLIYPLICLSYSTVVSLQSAFNLGY